MITGIRAPVFYFVLCAKMRKVNLGNQYQYLYYCVHLLTAMTYFLIGC